MAMQCGVGLAAVLAKPKVGGPRAGGLRFQQSDRLLQLRMLARQTPAQGRGARGGGGDAHSISHGLLVLCHHTHAPLVGAHTPATHTLTCNTLTNTRTHMHVSAHTALNRAV